MNPPAPVRVNPRSARQGDAAALQIPDPEQEPLIMGQLPLPFTLGCSNISWKLLAGMDRVTSPIYTGVFTMFLISSLCQETLGRFLLCDFRSSPESFSRSVSYFMVLFNLVSTGGQVVSELRGPFFNFPVRFLGNHMNFMLENATVGAGLLGVMIDIFNEHRPVNCITGESESVGLFIALAIGSVLSLKTFVNHSIPLAYREESLAHEKIVNECSNIHQTLKQKIIAATLSAASSGYFLMFFVKLMLNLAHKEISNSNLLAVAMFGLLLNLWKGFFYHSGALSRAPDFESRVRNVQQVVTGILNTAIAYSTLWSLTAVAVGQAKASEPAIRTAVFFCSALFSMLTPLRLIKPSVCNNLAVRFRQIGAQQRMEENANPDRAIDIPLMPAQVPR